MLRTGCCVCPLHVVLCWVVRGTGFIFAGVAGVGGSGVRVSDGVRPLST